MSCGCSPLGGASTLPTAVPDLFALEALTGVPDGVSVYVIDQAEAYRYEAANNFTPFLPLILPASEGGRWFRRSKAFVIGNYTMWSLYNSGGPFVAGWTPGQQQVSSANAPEIILSLSNLDVNPLLSDVCVDGWGNLWITSYRSAGVGVVGKIALHDTLQSGTPTPRTIINNGRGKFGIFDRGNNFLTTGPDGNTVRRLSPTQYRFQMTNTPTPIVALTVAGWVVNTDTRGVVDAFGNLWLGRYSQHSVNQISAAQQQANNAALVPAVVWSGANVAGPEGLAFGPNGLLWLADYDSNSVKAYDPAQPTGNPAITFTITTPAGFFNNPAGLAFDPLGNLWVGNYTDLKLMRFDAAQLTSSGAKVPPVVLTGKPSAGTNGLNVISFPNDPTRAGALLSGTLSL